MSVVSDSVVDTVKSKFDFTVDKFPLSGPDGLKTPLYGLFRSDTMDYVGKPCSKHYVAHQSDDVLALVESAGEAFEGVGDVQIGHSCQIRTVFIDIDMQLVTTDPP